MRRLLPPLLALTVAGCGSLADAELPPAATPAGGPVRTHPPRVARAGGETVRLDPRARRLTDGRRTVGAGIGPAGLVADGGRMLYVTDAGGDGVVVAHTRPRLEVTRRVGLPATTPYGIAYDGGRARLWVTLSATDELVELSTGSHPRPLRRYPTVHQPVAVRVRVQAIVVTGRSGATQRVVPRG